ncbi:MAG TPA: HPr-rel-A system PqqD family peptide chaperone [Allosphingosinicella sp.]|nr:HPr-rel-A system PqqD family peptide chaperone [Allosphingosinicella sp.]
MAGPIYIADKGHDMVAVPLDGLSLVYHAPSGATHIVAPPAPEILAALAQGPADAAELLRRLREKYEFDGEEVIHVRLGELEEAGLVRRA